MAEILHDLHVKCYRMLLVNKCHTFIKSPTKNAALYKTEHINIIYVEVQNTNKTLPKFQVKSGQECRGYGNKFVSRWSVKLRSDPTSLISDVRELLSDVVRRYESLISFALLEQQTYTTHELARTALEISTSPNSHSDSYSI